MNIKTKLKKYILNQIKISERKLEPIFKSLHFKRIWQLI